MRFTISGSLLILTCEGFKRDWSGWKRRTTRFSTNKSLYLGNDRR